MPRGKDAKRHSRYKAAGQLRRGAAKLGLISEFVKILSLTKRNCLFSRTNGLCRVKTIDNCFARGFVEFVSELERTYKFKRGGRKYKNTDRATECAMTNIGANLLKIACHSEDNNNLSPKNLLKRLQEDLSLNAQDDENDIFTMVFSGMHRSCIGRSALLCRHETNSLSNGNNTPSPEFVILTVVRKRLRPLTKREVETS